MQRNMAQSLFEHGQVRTTISKARDIRAFCERLITIAVKSRKYRASGATDRALAMRRRIHRVLGDRGIIPESHRATYEGMSDAARAKTMRMASGRRHRSGEPKGRLAFTAESVTHRLIETVAARYEDRPGGYTRLIRLAQRRVGDASYLAIVQLVGDEQAPGAVSKPDRSARRRRADARYALAIKLTKPKSAGKRTTPAEEPKSTDPESKSSDEIVNTASDAPEDEA